MRKVGLLVLLAVAVAVMPVAAAKTGTASIILSGIVEYNFQVYSDWAKTTLMDLTKAEAALKVDGIGFTTNYPGTWYVYLTSSGNAALVAPPAPGGPDGALVKNGIAVPALLTTAIAYQATLGGAAVKFTPAPLIIGNATVTHTGPVTDWVLDLNVTHAAAGILLEEGTYTDTVIVTMSL